MTNGIQKQTQDLYKSVSHIPKKLILVTLQNGEKIKMKKQTTKFRKKNIKMTEKIYILS